MVCYAQQYVMSRNPLSHKDKTLFMVQTDSWDIQEAYNGRPRNNMPDTFSYRDATALYHSTIPLHKVAMTKTGGAVSLPDNRIKPFLARARVNTRDYFAVFEETFLYGEVWSQAADDGFQNVVILSEATNQKLFQGKNSIGETIRFEGNFYRVVAVVKFSSQKKNKVQDIDRGMSGLTGGDTQLYFPYGVLAEHEISVWGADIECPDHGPEYGTSYQSRLKGPCLWLTFWAEFADKNHKQEFEKFLTDYILEQKSQGLYPRPLQFALSNATQKLAINRYDNGFLALLSKFGFGLLLVCTLNCIAMLLVKFLKCAPESSVRRALGASRLTIFFQYVIESALIGLLGGLLSVVLTYAGMLLLHYGFTTPATEKGLSISNFDSVFMPHPHIMILTICAAMAASLCAGLYPAWRICQTPPAQYLKLQ